MWVFFIMMSLRTLSSFSSQPLRPVSATGSCYSLLYSMTVFISNLKRRKNDEITNKYSDLTRWDNSESQHCPLPCFLIFQIFDPNLHILSASSLTFLCIDFKSFVCCCWGGGWGGRTRAWIYLGATDSSASESNRTKCQVCMDDV